AAGDASDELHRGDDRGQLSGEFYVGQRAAGNERGPTVMNAGADIFRIVDHSLFGIAIPVLTDGLHDGGSTAGPLPRLPLMLPGRKVLTTAGSIQTAVRRVAPIADVDDVDVGRSNGVSQDCILHVLRRAEGHEHTAARLTLPFDDRIEPKLRELE